MHSHSVQELSLSYRRGNQSLEEKIIAYKINQLEGGRDKNQIQFYLSPKLSPAHCVSYYFQWCRKGLSIGFPLWMMSSKDNKK